MDYSEREIISLAKSEITNDSVLTEADIDK